VDAERTIQVRVRRQDGPETSPYWQNFRIPWAPQHNVISLLLEIRRCPVTVEGERVGAPAFDAACLEEVCGSCPMRINGRPRMACTALVDQLPQPIVLEPLEKFPVVRDLSVDRRRMFEALKRIRGWVPIDGTYDLGPGPRIAPERQQIMYSLDRCITCGICLEVCPQVQRSGGFIGAAAIGQALLFNLHPTGEMNRDERLDELMGPHGIADCGNAQNCVEACPKEIPLTYAIGEIGRQTTVKWMKDLFRR
jgi:succinate dehydrogenase / fumarate reductase iron-sulfur subunit